MNEYPRLIFCLFLNLPHTYDRTKITPILPDYQVYHRFLKSWNITTKIMINDNLVFQQQPCNDNQTFNRNWKK